MNSVNIEKEAMGKDDRMRCEKKEGKMTDVTAAAGGGWGGVDVTAFMLNERNNVRRQRVGEGGRQSDEKKSWEIRGTLRAHMAVDMVKVDCDYVMRPYSG